MWSGAGLIYPHEESIMETDDILKKLHSISARMAREGSYYDPHRIAIHVSGQGSKAVEALLSDESLKGCYLPDAPLPSASRTSAAVWRLRPRTFPPADSAPPWARHRLVRRPRHCANLRKVGSAALSALVHAFPRHLIPRKPTKEGGRGRCRLGEAR